LAGYIHRQYISSAAVISIAGGVEHAEAVKVVKRCFGGWKTGGGTQTHKPFEESPARRVKIETRDIEQTHMCLILGLSLFDPKRFTLDMLNVVLGSGMSSRLFSEVRDKLGLAYSVQSYVDHMKDTGSLVVYAGVDSAKAEQALEAIIRELLRFRDETISANELTKAKEMSKGHLVLRLEDSRYMAGWLGGQEIRAGRVLTIDEVSAMVDAVTPVDIQQLANHLIKPSSMRLAVVGPHRKSSVLRELVAG